jgi:hypothetical protein
MNIKLEIAKNSDANKYVSEFHYLKRPVIRTKMLSYWIMEEDHRIGCIIWGTPHFTKKKNLFGFPGLPDKWTVLMLNRFYLEKNTKHLASHTLAMSIRSVQKDWINNVKIPYPDNPFVPELLISYSDDAYGHQGTIYKASNWQVWDQVKSKGNTRHKSNHSTKPGVKTCWIYRLKKNKRLWHEKRLELLQYRKPITINSKQQPKKNTAQLAIW